MPGSGHSKESPRPEDEEVQQNKEDKVQEKGSGGSGGSGGLGIILAIVCLILEAIVFLFCVVGTPIDCFRAKTEAVFGMRMCYSMWGSKQCGSHKTNPSGAMYKGFPSSKIRDTMNAAAAFAIISIFFSLIAMFLTILLVFKCIFKVIPGIFSIITFITTLIVWACQAGAFHKTYSYIVFVGIGYSVAERKISTTYNYAGSFGLFVTAWCLQTIEMILVFFA